MRPIDADALFDKAFEVWGTEVDGGETNLFMEMINNAPTIAPPPNGPLTLEQLRGMDGEPVWVRNHCTGDYTCRVIDSVDKHFTFFTDGITKENRSFGSYWTAYRRKPEEGTA